ncbi:MAG: DUF1731 domain-containing protein [Bacteroidales bacterium]|uniref:DUF1731 domain-containing protein n=1 Tax=Porphyromonas sp. TaxID=1924944 RepID=UPI002971351C|nr:DUF1731 domain-containing protein [Porphyromonas sp.]MDD7437807.1 DUF1731 domain-containing protein [Bacteroidales bacterium]MDY3067949.1 DUF1731 domain-containing protein [Porphyromonas sp.]
MERVLLTGSNEILTRHFMGVYEGLYDMRLLTRHPKADHHFYWNPLKDELDPEALEGVDYIVHVGGSTENPLTLDVRHRDVLTSYRAGGTDLIGRMLMALGQEVKSFITISSTTYYGSYPNPYIHTEASPSGDDFLAQLHSAGEEEAYILEVEALTRRSVALRFGNILCHYGGILPHIAAGSDLGLAIIYGKGEQIVPWVHVSDAVRMIRWAIDNNELYGAYNCVAPEWITYDKLVSTAAYVRRGRTYPIHLPKCILRMIRQELAEQYLHSNRISTNHLMQTGFTFLYPDIHSALTSVYDL